MKYNIILNLILIFCLSLNAQDSIVERIMLDENIKDVNEIELFLEYDYSKIWTQTSNRNILGIIGKDHQRLKIKLITIDKAHNPRIYKVNGKSCVDGNICEFNGTIEIKEIFQLKSFQYGVDDEFKEKGIINQGLLIAEYNFNESIEQNHSGKFEGRLYSKWYATKSKEIFYDNIQFQSDGYLNNAFVGHWRSYSTDKMKICNWGDFRVPNCRNDFDIGTGEFAPSEKYYSQGWENYQNAWLYNGEEAITIELEEWWK